MSDEKGPKEYRGEMPPNDGYVWLDVTRVEDTEPRWIQAYQDTLDQLTRDVIELSRIPGEYFEPDNRAGGPL